MRIAVVGSGIAGLMAAHQLHGEHEISVFEAASRLGGHANTVEVEVGGRSFPVDTGFIVYNEGSYPHFKSLLDEFSVPTKPSDMSFSVKCDSSGLEYNGTSLNGLFAQRRNLLSPSFLEMVRDIFRFFRETPALLEQSDEGPTLGEYLREHSYSQTFIDQHLVPMASAIWSAKPSSLADFPAKSLVRFFQRQGFLQATNRPVWRTIDGGSREYVNRVSAPFRPRVRFNSPVQRIRRVTGGVILETTAAGPERFDHVVLALHSDQALRLLSDPSPAETATLGAMRYQRNDAVLHTDATLLPRRKRAWAAWNYHLPVGSQGGSAVTYLMNRLQGLPTDIPVCVTLNRSNKIDPRKVLRRFVYHHPSYDMASVKAQQAHGLISGLRNTHYCGAYWGYGFHEDGAESAVRAVNILKNQLARPKLVTNLRHAS